MPEILFITNEQHLLIIDQLKALVDARDKFEVPGSKFQVPTSLTWNRFKHGTWDRLKHGTWYSVSYHRKSFSRGSEKPMLCSQRHQLLKRTEIYFAARKNR